MEEKNVKIKYTPKEDKDDGVKYINIYSGGKTHLGKFLSNWTNLKISVSEGKFKNIEGYWYYLLTDSNRKEKLKSLNGFEAKKLGKELKNKDIENTDEFKNKIKEAIRRKIKIAANYFEEFKNSKLPFVHHYVFGNKIVNAKETWLVDYFEELRKEVQNWKKCKFENCTYIVEKYDNFCHNHINKKCKECNEQALMETITYDLNFQNQYKNVYCSKLCNTVNGLRDEKILDTMVIYFNGQQLKYKDLKNAQNALEYKIHSKDFNKKVDDFLKDE